MKIKILKIFFIFLIQFSSNVLIAAENKILFKVDNEIITTIDIYNEIKYLKLFNQNFKNLEEIKIFEISKNSMIREKIKEIDLKKRLTSLDIDDDTLNSLILNQTKNIGFSNIKEFKNFLKKNSLEFETIKYKFLIEILWNQFIYEKFINEVKINKIDIKEKILSNNKQIEFHLSEIIFDIKNKNDLNKRLELIQRDIKLKGFENAALIHGISDSANNGGDIGWINLSSLNPKLKKKIEKLEVNEFTDPIVIPGGFIILKLKDKREVERKINIDEEIDKIVKQKVNEQLNQFSIIYFNKVKKNIQINEL